MSTIEPTFHFTSRSVADTDAIAAKVAKVIQRGDVVALVGTLGAGKTRFVQGLAVAMGHQAESVTSPTYVLVNEYQQGTLPIYHFDVYRLNNDAEFLDLGADEYFDGDGVTLVEWGNQVEHLLPERASIVAIELPNSVDPDRQNERQFTFRGNLAKRLGELIE